MIPRVSVKWWLWLGCLLVIRSPLRLDRRSFFFLVFLDLYESISGVGWQMLLPVVFSVDWVPISRDN